MRRSGSRLWSALLHLIVCLGVAIMAFPIVWMLLVSLKDWAETLAYPLTWLPKAPTMDNFEKVLVARNFARSFINSMIVSFVTTALAMIVARAGGRMDSAASNISWAARCNRFSW